MADKDVVNRRVQRFREQAAHELNGRLVSDTMLTSEDAEVLAEELEHLIRPYLEDLEEAGESLASLRRKLTIAEKEIVHERMRANVRVSDQTVIAAKLRAQMEQDRLDVMRANLLVAEIDVELRAAGITAPAGIEAVRSAMGFLRRYDAMQMAYHDFLARIADIEGRESEDGPGEPVDLKDAMLRLNQIRDVVKEFDEYERG